MDIQIVYLEEPSTRPPVHVHRWAWTVRGHVECYDCGARG